MFFSNKFDLIVSIGEDCACTSYLRRFNLQEYSYPFDWLTKASFQTRIDLLINDFANFLNKENIHFMEKPTGVNVDNNHDYYKDVLLDFYFYHDFRTDNIFDDEFIKVKDKYERRIKRLYQSISDSKNILFVWWSRDKQQDESLIIDSYQKLKDKFRNKNIYLLLIEPSEDYMEKVLCDGQVSIIRYDNISYKHNPQWNETMGNEINNMNIFSKIQKARSVIGYLKMFFYKIAKIFVNLIPNRKIRHKLRDRLIYHFYRNKL